MGVWALRKLRYGNCVTELRTTSIVVQSSPILIFSYSHILKTSSLIQTVLANLIQQRPRRQLQKIRGACLVATGPLEGLLDEAALENGRVLLHGQLIVGQ